MMKLGDKSLYIHGDESWLNMGLLPFLGEGWMLFISYFTPYLFTSHAIILKPMR